MVWSRWAAWAHAGGQAVAAAGRKSGGEEEAAAVRRALSTRRSMLGVSPRCVGMVWVTRARSPTREDSEEDFAAQRRS